MVINTNIEAQATANNLNASQLNLAKSLARLSSGSKIIVPSDDAAGLAVSSRLNSQIKRLDSALSNVVNAVSFTQTQDGFMKTIDKAFRRMGELAILSQDTTKSNEDRALYNQEFVQLKDYVAETAKQDFNGVSLFGGQTLDVTVDAEGTTFTMVGINLNDPTYTSAINSGTDSWQLTSSAYRLSKDGFEIGAGVTAYKSTVDLWRATSGTWTTTDANVAQVDTVDITAGPITAGAGKAYSVTIDGPGAGGGTTYTVTEGAQIAAGNTSVQVAAALVAEINAGTNEGVTAAVATGSNRITLTSDTAGTIFTASGATTDTTASTQVDTLTYTTTAAGATANGTYSVTIAGTQYKVTEGASADFTKTGAATDSKLIRNALVAKINAGSGDPNVTAAPGTTDYELKLTAKASGVVSYSVASTDTDTAVSTVDATPVTGLGAGVVTDNGYNSAKGGKANVTAVKYGSGSVVKENITAIDTAATTISSGGFLAADPVPSSGAQIAHLTTGDRTTRKAGELVTVNPGSEDALATALVAGDIVNVAKATQDISAFATELGADYDDVNLKSVVASQIALTLVKLAIGQVATDRAKLGAVQSRLNFTNEQLTVTKENLSAAISRIADVDVAEEATNYARYQILVASGTEMLKQANQLPQSALQLLR